MYVSALVVVALGEIRCYSVVTPFRLEPVWTEAWLLTPSTMSSMSPASRSSVSAACSWWVVERRLKSENVARGLARAMRSFVCAVRRHRLKIFLFIVSAHATNFFLPPRPANSQCCCNMAHFTAHFLGESGHGTRSAGRRWGQGSGRPGGLPFALIFGPRNNYHRPRRRPTKAP